MKHIGIVAITTAGNRIFENTIASESEKMTCLD